MVDSATMMDLPGTRLFAPQARLVDAAGSPLQLDGQAVSQDIVSAKVTRVASGVSQVEVVLNNQRHDAEHRPLVPTWRYNRMDSVSFGTRMRVDFRYGNETWTPMILARVTDVSFLFPQATGGQLTLHGEDLLSLLKTRPPEKEKPDPYKGEQEAAIVEAAVKASGAGLKVRATAPTPAFTAALTNVTHQPTLTYLQFIEAIAERMDYEVYVDFDAPGASGVSLHFEPARSATLGQPVELRWGRDLMDFKPVFKVWDLLTGAVASGTEPGKRARFTRSVPMDQAINDLHASPGAAAGGKLVSAADARKSAFQGENKPEDHVQRINVTNLDPERAKLQATAVLRRSARQFLTADITTIGRTELRPGIHVDLRGLSAPFDGVYYVAQTVHTLSAAGYLTASSLRRPGMLDPSQYGSTK